LLTNFILLTPAFPRIHLLVFRAVHYTHSICLNPSFQMLLFVDGLYVLRKR